MATYILFWLICISLCAVLALANNCPKQCDCLGAIIDCSDKRLTELPPNIPIWVEELDLGENPDLKIRNDSFLNLRNLRSLSLRNLKLQDVPELPNLQHLKRLSLSRNHLTSISPSWLQEMTSLQEIDLSKNDFDLFDPSQFQHQNLRKIDLKSNRIRAVVPSTPFSLPSLNDLRLSRNRIGDEAFKNLSLAFSHTPNLKTLDLNRNSLEKLEGLMFQHLVNVSLSTLKLRRNNIVDLPDGAFFGLKSITTLQLDNNKNITQVSNGWLFGLESLKSLTLSHNKIHLIKENAWEGTKLITLLDISYNQLGCRHREPVFNELSNLQELFVTHNCLSNLNSDTFDNLSKLKVLDISHNQIQWSVEDSTGAFKSLTSLVSLNLAYNKIETIHNNVFKSLIALTTLNLSGNDLKTLSQNPFIKMRLLERLYFNTSSLVCDCRLVWLPKWLATQSFNAVKAFCAYPQSMKGVSIYDLDPKNMKCEVSPQPVITTSPSDQTILYGDNMTLECVAFTEGDEVFFTWMKNREIQEPFKVQTFMNVEETEDRKITINKVISRLNVINITHEDGGKYQCIARNSYGPSYSPLASIEVHRFPYLTKTPKSLEVKEGNVAELYCEGLGFPAPNISLKKQDDVFHAAGERRLHYLAADSVYFIKPVLPQDDGTYVCTATNVAGTVNAKAKISVIQTPSFSRAIEYNQEASKGQSIVLECQGTGHPKPKVTWHKGGMRVLADENRMLLDDGQFLLLFNVNENDDGAYLCELTNTVGTQRRKIVLTVKTEYLLPTTGIVVISVAVSMVFTSIIWVLIIYKTWKRSLQGSCSDTGSRGGLNHIYSSHLSVNNLRPTLKDEVHNLTPLLTTPQLLDGYTTNVGGGQDSGSEHSSGKDSGVGDSAHRSNEDLHRNGDVRGLSRRNHYQDASPSVPRSKEHNIDTNSDLASDESRPKLSTFGASHYLDPSRTSGNSPIYASLRRGSTSKLLPVPSPVTPAGSMAGSLPRYTHRSHSNTGSIGRNRGGHYTRSGSSHTLPRSGTPPPTSMAHDQEDQDPKDFWKTPVSTTSPNTEKQTLSIHETAEQIYNYYSDPHCTFGSLSRNPKKRSLSQNQNDPHIYPSR